MDEIVRDEKVVHVDLRPIGSDRRPRDDWRHLVPPGLRARPAAGHGFFAVALLANAVVFALIGMARLVWNIVEEGLFYEHCSFCGFQGFWLLDKSMPYFVAFALFAIAAGVWSRR